MIQPNSKVEYFNGIRFCDQDILFDDFVYENYCDFIINLDYCNPGFGFVLINNDSHELNSNSECFLFRFGYTEASIIHKTGYISETIESFPLNLSRIEDFHNITVKFTKNNNYINLTINDTISVFSQTNNNRLYNLKKNLNKYCVGIYSNAGNTIKNISSGSLIPSHWNVNMSNTIGGRIIFHANGFTLENCSNNAEIEQCEIDCYNDIDSDKLYLSYDITQGSDIKCYVFDSYSDKLYDEDKNILNYNDMSIPIKKYMALNIKFVGTHGSVKNIVLNHNEGSKYAPTSSDEKITNESNIIIKKSSIQKLKINFKIGSINELDSYIIKDSFIGTDNTENTDIIKFTDINYNEDSMLSAIYDVNNNGKIEVNIYNDSNESIYNSEIGFSESEFFTIFNDADIDIYNFEVIKPGETEILDYINSSLPTIDGIPLSRTMPIIITDKNGEPLDISSSYRIQECFYNDKDISDDGNIVYNSKKETYIFTNIEREIFDPNFKLVTNKNISNKINSIKIFGIKTSDINIDNIYKINKTINDLSDDFCNKEYDIIDSQYITSSPNSNIISIDSSIDIYSYKYLVVDYLKNDSYSINANYNNSTYTVDISTDKEVCYYFSVNSQTSDNYKIIEIKDDIINSNNCSYLCIRNGSDIVENIS